MLNTDIPDFESKDAAFAWMEEQVDDPCVDNYRFAFEDDTQAMAEYRDIESNGCCGSFDREITIAGKPAMIGCNYGH